jgi:hypothetical protein
MLALMTTRFLLPIAITPSAAAMCVAVVEGYS